MRSTTMQPDETREQEEVLEAFAAAHPVPTAKAVIEHCRAHPRHAAAIRELASLLLETGLLGETARAEGPGDRVADERDLAVVARAMGGLYGDGGGPADLQDLIDQTGRTAEAVFARVDFTGVAARRLVDGRLLPPLPAELVSALAGALDVTAAEILAAVDASAASPRMGMAKAARGAQPLQRGFAETERESDMDQARKAYWLGKA